MRLISINTGNVHEAVQFVNTIGVAASVLTIAPVSGGSVTVLRTTDYPNYCHLCKKLGQTPISTEEYFK